MSDYLSSTEEQKLRDYLVHRSGAKRVDIIEVHRLDGGAIQENLSLDLNFDAGPMRGRQSFVLRRDAATKVLASRSREQEFNLLKAAWDAGVKVPEPLWLGVADEVFARPFYIMRKISGEARGHILTKPGAIDDPNALARDLGIQLARIHKIPAKELAGLSFLGEPPEDPIICDIAAYRAYLDSCPLAYPAFEWGLRWCELHAPQAPSSGAPSAPVLLHRDFRTGNYMVEDGRLVGILDWEFASWGDPMSDLGWFCAACWRFNGREREAGGIASREAFYEGYELESGTSVDHENVLIWEVMAHLRWAIIALQQGARFSEGHELSLDLALTGRIRPDELSYAVLQMTRPDRWSTSAAERPGS